MNGNDIERCGLDRLRRDLAQLRARYASAEPFPHIVLDDVLDEELFARAVAEFPATDDPSWTGYLHVNETKFANPRPHTWGPTLRAVADAFFTDEFLELLGELTGFEGLHADPTMDGGGLHQTLRGGHLNVHTDFTANHNQRSWRRRVNVLLYLNDEWSPEWGGALELWDSKVTRRVRVVEPRGNRMVVFSTTENSFHGHPDALACPDGVARRSLALYFYTAETAPRRRATAYRPRPGDGAKALAILLDSGVVRVYDTLKTRLGVSDRFASGALHRLHRTANRVRRTHGA